MTVFAGYSQYYDMLYQDKDYSAEAAFVLDVVGGHKPGKLSVLDLGCGTGVHARLFAEAGMTVHGVDMSDTMLERARSQLTEPPAGAGALSFSEGDARTVRVGRTFDVVVALFHVVSYQVGNDDLLQMFDTVAAHLEPGGLFVFDYWFGPAVLTERPEVRVKRLHGDGVVLTRIAEPALDERAARVDVHYHVIACETASNTFTELRETHAMRYLSLPEIDLLARLSGLEVVESFEWLTRDDPSTRTWSVCSVVRKPY